VEKTGEETGSIPDPTSADRAGGNERGGENGSRDTNGYARGPDRDPFAAGSFRDPFGFNGSSPGPPPVSGSTLGSALSPGGMEEGGGLPGLPPAPPTRGPIKLFAEEVELSSIRHRS
jgi:hypothetical protein